MCRMTCALPYQFVPLAWAIRCENRPRHWDPLTMSYGGGSGLPGDAIELPTELMMPPGERFQHTKPSELTSLLVIYHVSW